MTSDEIGTTSSIAFSKVGTWIQITLDCVRALSFAEMTSSTSFDLTQLNADSPFVGRECDGENCINEYDLSAYYWIVIASGFFAFTAAYGIGANDIANAFATSVGAKSLTLNQAIILGSIFEFFGAFFFGSHVTDTMTEDIVSASCYYDLPATLMYGMLCTIFVVSVWLVAASSFGLPVSTTHSTIGGIIGFALVSSGPGCVTWFDETDKFPFFSGVISIVVSWFISPVLSGLCALTIFLAVRHAVLRRENSYERAFYIYPALVAFTLIVNIFFIIYKGCSGLTLDDTPLETAVAWSFGLGIFVALLSWMMVPRLKSRIDAEFAVEDIASSVTSVSNAAKTVEPTANAEEIFPDLSDWNPHSIFDHNVHSAVHTDNRVSAIHRNAEVFDNKTERAFTYLQVVTACFDSFGHGSNDVANAMAPFATVYMVYTTGKVNNEVNIGNSAYWILAVGGAGIVLGLATYGFLIIEAIGVRLAKITPSRGFSIELGSALVVVLGSRFGIPLSTTHCQVGATVGVGVLEGKEGINWHLLSRVIVGWLLTLVVVGFSVALLFAQGLYSPGNEPIQQET